MTAYFLQDPFIRDLAFQEIQAAHIKWSIVTHRTAETFREFLGFSLQKLS